jgi:hypothetical protein
MSNAHWPAPWTKQPWPLPSRVEHTVCHSAMVVGALRPFWSKMSWLIHIHPE